MNHNMHAMNQMPASDPAQQRFLPWHRVYLITLEHLLQQYEPGLMIPYWDWAVDQQIPSWLANFLPTVPLPMDQRGRNRSIQVSRTGGANNLPTTADIQQALNLQDYTSFATQLEALHDQVHEWFSPTTLSQIMIAPADPLFFMHHANVDRIWSLWQQGNPTQNSILSGDDLILDPFPYKEPDTRSIQSMGYNYL